MSLTPLIAGLPYNGSDSSLMLGMGLSSTPPGPPPPAQSTSGISIPPGTQVPITNPDGSPGVFNLSSGLTTPTSPISSLPTVTPAQAAQFNPKTMQGVITPALQAKDLGNIANGGRLSFSGADCRVMIEVQTPTGNTSTPSIAKQFIELTTLSVSIHRSKAQVPAVFSSNTRGIPGSPFFAAF